MSFISLEKYLYGSAKVSFQPDEAKAASSYLGLIDNMLASVSSSVLAGEVFGDLAHEVERLRGELTTKTPEEALAVAGQDFCSILQQFKDRFQRADEERADDFRKVLAILNEAFGHLSARTDKSDVRLKKLEATLQHASKIEDLRTLKNHLAEVLRYVREESAEEQNSGQAQVEAIGTQIQQMQKAASRFKLSMANREEALAELGAMLGTAESDGYRYAALFVADSLPAMRTRHGNEIAENFLEQLGRKELCGLAPEGKVFCWSSNAVLLLWNSDAERENVRDLGKRLKSPYEYRALVGSRMATFAVGLRSFVMKLQNPISDVVWELDHFERGVARC